MYSIISIFNYIFVCDKYKWLKINALILYLLDISSDMKKECWFSLSLFLLFPLWGYSQSRLKGCVELNGTKIEYANVILQEASDSAFIAGAISDSLGQFHFNNVSEGRYILKVSYIGCEKKQLLVSLPNKEMVDVGVLKLKSAGQSLDTVVVIGSLPAITKKENLLTIKVENTMLKDLPTAIDVLSYLPGITVVSDKITVMGKNNILILINNREVSSTSEIERLQVSQIKSVSINQAPGVKYDSQYKAIIKINTKNTIENGIELGHYSKFGRKYAHTEYADINYNLAHTLISIGAELRNRKDLSKYDVEINHTDKLNSYKSSQSIYNDRNSYDFSLGIRHERNKHAIQLYEDYYTSTNRPQNVSNTFYLSENSEASNLIVHKGSDYKEKNNRMNISYDFKISSLNSIEVNFDHIYKDTKDNQAIIEDGSHKNIFYTGRYNVLTPRIDYTNNALHLFNFTLGTKFIYVKNREKITSQGMQSTVDYDQVNKIRETTWNSYLLLGKEWKKVHFQGGLRYELKSFHYSEQVDHSVVKNKVNTFFPYFSMEYNPTEILNVCLSYDRRMNLPTYNQLNTIVTYFDKYTYSVGNPTLSPTFYNNVSLSFFLWKAVNISLEESFIKDRIEEVPISDESDNSVVKFTPVNIRKSALFDANINYIKSIKKYRVDMGATLLLPHSFSDDRFKKMHSDPTYSVVLNQTYRVSSCFQPYIKTSFCSKYEDMISTTDESFNLTVGCNIALLNQKLKVSILANDLLKTSSPTWKTRSYNIENIQKNNMDTRYVSISIKYNIKDSGKKMKKNNVDEILNRM